MPLVAGIVSQLADNQTISAFATGGEALQFRWMSLSGDFVTPSQTVVFTNTYSALTNV